MLKTVSFMKRVQFGRIMKMNEVTAVIVGRKESQRIPKKSRNLLVTLLY